MSKRAEQRALEAYPEQDMYRSANHIQAQQRKIKRRVYREGYRQAEKDFLEKAAEWWYQHIVGFIGDDLAKEIVDEFRKTMEEDE